MWVLRRIGIEKCPVMIQMLFAGGQTGLERRDGSVVGVGLMQHFFQPHDFKEIKYKLYELHNL
jgi:hypothetical protein